MPGQFYDNAIQTQHEAAAADFSVAATVFSFVGPTGRYGRILDFTLNVTTAFTVADTSVDIGENGGDVDAQLAAGIIAFTGSAIGDNISVGTAQQYADGMDINPDATTDVVSDGGSTAGAGDARVLVAWW
jgi:hypothetical protein